MPSNPKILCIDVGRGTQDILLYDSRKKIENCLTLVLPSFAEINSHRLKKAVLSGKDPLFFGVNMGGFPLFGPVSGHLNNRQHVYATRSAAVTFNDDLDCLVERGLTIVDDDWWTSVSPDKVYQIETKDIDFKWLGEILERFDEKWDLVAVAVQDHGVAPKGESDRRFRMDNYQKTLSIRPKLSDLMYARGQIPGHLTRMKAVESLISESDGFFMDTGLAAILGSLEDENIASQPEKIVINIGNGHTLAAYLSGEILVGLWEHHTSKLNAQMIVDYLCQLINGTVSDKQIFDEGGHGAYLHQEFKFTKKDLLVAVTGPNRDILKGRGYYMACPYGNMMLTGAYGLTRGCLAKSSRI